MFTFFKNYPLIRYGSGIGRNLLVKSRLVTSTFEKYEVYYDYIVKQNERADMLAHRFYEDSYLDWVIFLSNNIQDPYYDWVMEDEVFKKYMEKKYGMTIYETQNLISHYVYSGIGEDKSIIDRITWTIAPETFGLYSPQEKSGWTPVYTFDVETQANEDKRKIRILDKNYLPQLKIEISQIFANG